MSRTLLAFAFASTGRPDERALLVSWLEGEHFGDEWLPIVEAALSLGVLRERSVLPKLSAAAETGDSIAGNAAHEAIQWMEEGPWTVSAQGIGTSRRRVRPLWGSVEAALTADGSLRSELFSPEFAAAMEPPGEPANALEPEVDVIVTECSAVVLFDCEQLGPSRGMEPAGLYASRRFILAGPAPTTVRAFSARR